VDKINVEEMHAALLAGDPRVILGTSGNNLVINPQMLDHGQERIVAEAFVRVLAR
jgi:hypothetical protein